MNHVTERPSFQGDLMIRRVTAIPADAKLIPPTGDAHILAHSETGHHHVVEATNACHFIDNMNDFISYLDVADESVLKHMRDFDTHAPHALSPGLYEVRRQREYSPEGWRRAAD